MFDYLNCLDWLMFTGPMFMPQDEAHMSSKSAKASEVHAKELIMWTKFKDLQQKGPVIMDKNISRKEKPSFEVGSTYGIMRRFLPSYTTYPARECSNLDWLGLALAVNRRCWEGALRATEDGKERQHTAPQYLSQGSV
ncbi:hypothetical protein SDJN03_08751, partial [Cucurbita argyrosperma subsp. sororia]